MYNIKLSVAFVFILLLFSCAKEVKEVSVNDYLYRDRMGVLVVYMDPGIDHKRAEEVLLAAKELGVKWIRIGFIWPLMNPEKDVYDFKEADWIINKAIEYELSILPIVTWTPLWANSASHLVNKIGAYTFYYPPTENNVGEYDAGLGSKGTGFDYLSKFAETIASRYKNKISHWELWNEPDMPYFLNLSGDKADIYCKMLHYFNHGVKIGNPEAKVVFGGLAQGEAVFQCDVEFLNKVLRNKEYPIKNNFDIFNFHVNFKIPADILKQVEDNKALLAKYGIIKKYWITEVSYTSEERYQNLTNYKEGEKGFAKYAYDSFECLLSKTDAEVIFWASLHDYQPKDSGPYLQSGLYTLDLKIKEAGRSIQKIASTKKKGSS